MARLTLALLAVVSLAAGSSTEFGPTTLVSPSFGVVEVVSVTRHGDTASFRHRLVARDHDRWRDITPPGMHDAVYSIDFLDARHGWVFSGDCAGGHFALYRTIDSGQSWRTSVVPGAFVGCHAGDGAELDFVDATHGWLTTIAATAPFAQLYRTVDGGATWARLPHRLPILGRISFRTATDGWLAENFFRLSASLYRTRDAGRTWRAVRLATPRGYSAKHAFPQQPTFFGSSGVLPVTLARPTKEAIAFYTTADRGETWRLRTIRPIERPFAGRNSPLALYVDTTITSPTAWWIADGSRRPVVSFTGDGGRTWFRTPDLPAATGWQLSAAGARTAWLSTYEPYRLFETTDRGRTWHRLFPR